MTRSAGTADGPFDRTHRCVAIAGDVAALAGSRLSARREPCSLADLLAWEARIERVAEWPFDTPTLLRFALALLVPLGSWLGGALAQLAIERVIR